MVTKAQYKLRAALLLIPFFLILVALFMPWYHGPKGDKVNGLTYFDEFFNEVSKGSSFSETSQAAQMKKAEELSDSAFKSMINGTIKMKGDKKVKYSPEDAAMTAVKLLTVSGLQATASGDKVTVTGDLGLLAKTVVQDSIDMYNNQGNVLEDKYGLNARQALYTWHQVMDGLSKFLTKDEKLEAAKTMQGFMTKAIEPAYNYYGVKVTPVREEIPLLAFALIFYVVYTVWYGFGIMYLFEGLGVNLGH